MYTSGYAFGISVIGNYAYVAAYHAGIRIVDVSNVARPSLSGGLITAGKAKGITVVGNYAYITDLDAGITIIDVSNAAGPILRGGLGLSDIAQGITVVGKYAYVADSRAGIKIIDLTIWEVSGSPSLNEINKSYNLTVKAQSLLQTVQRSFSILVQLNPTPIIIDGNVSVSI